MPKYQGQDVTIVRDAVNGDDGYNPAVTQVLIRTSDGTERAVASSEVVADPPAPATSEGKEIAGREKDTGFAKNRQADRTRR